MDIRVQPLIRPPAELSFQADGDGGIPGGTKPAPLSLAAPWMALAAALSMRLYVRHISLDPATLTFVDVLVRMGVRVREEVTSLQPGEWMGTLDVHPSRMRGIALPSELVAKVREEIPLLAVLGTLAAGTTTIRDSFLAEGENRTWCRRLCANLRLLNAAVEEHGDGFVITGGRHLQGNDLPTGGDSSLATAMVIAGLAGDRESLVRDVDTAVAAQRVFFDQVFAAQFERLSPVRPPANSATDTRCCADAVRSRLP